MDTQRDPETILGEIAAIEVMERGRLCEMRRSSGKVYYNLQRWIKGKNHCEYVPAKELDAVRQAVANHTRFMDLIGEYAAVVEQRTRQARKATGSSEQKGGSANGPPLQRPRR
jgi:hypothetical protein